MIPLTLTEVARVVGSETDGSVPAIQVTGVSTDSRTLRRGDVFFAIRGDRFDGHDFLSQALAGGAAGCVVLRGANLDGNVQANERVLRVDDPVAALGRLAAHHRGRSKARVVAITGSNGKTTTKCMVDHVLAGRLRGRASIKSYNNHIGLPLALLSAEPDDAYLIVEIGANAPGEVAALGRLASPDIGVVTSIGPAHLEGFGDLERVRVEKLSLFDQVKDGGLCVVPIDAEAFTRRSVVTFGTDEAADVWVSGVSADLDGVRFTLNGRYGGRLTVPGAHNASNAAAAFAVCREFGFEQEEILASLATFRLPAMRLTPLRVGRLTVIDDSYNANPASMVAALATLAAVRGARRVFVAGDMHELGDASPHWHEEIGRIIAASGIEVLVAVGRERAWIARGAAEASRPPQIVSYADTAEACADLPERLKPGDVILVKGSRAVGLERLTERIRELHSRAPTCAETVA